MLLGDDLTDILWSRRTAALNNVTSVLNKSWAEKLYGRGKRRENTVELSGNRHSHLTLEQGAVFLIDMDGSCNR